MDRLTDRLPLACGIIAGLLLGSGYTHQGLTLAVLGVGATLLLRMRPDILGDS